MRPDTRDGAERPQLAETCVPPRFTGPRRALFDAYFGEHPVSSDAKTRVTAECPDLLAAGSESLPD